MLKNTHQLPPIWDPKYLWILIEDRLQKTDKNGKFFNLQQKQLTGLIKPSIEAFPKEKNKIKRYRKKINAHLKQIAMLTAVNDSFIEDILKIAEKYNLVNYRWEIKPIDFYGYRGSPALMGADARLKLASLYHWKQNPETDIGKYWLPDRFEEDVSALIKKYGLEFYWYESVTGLIVSGEWYLPKNTSVIELRIYDEKGNIEPNIIFHPSSITTPEEYACRDKEIQRLKEQVFKFKNKRVRPVKDLSEKILKTSLEELWDMAEEKYNNNKKSLLFIKSRQRSIQRLKKKQSDLRKETLKSLPKEVEVNINILKSPIGKIYYY